MGRDALIDRRLTGVPDWLLWLLPVPLATAGAIAWTAWSSRTRGPEGTAEGIEAYEKFRAALASPPKPPRDG
jgi:cytochrome c-type biogenesis protein CcmH/NrfF